MLLSFLSVGLTRWRSLTFPQRLLLDSGPASPPLADPAPLLVRAPTPEISTAVVAVDGPSLPASRPQPLRIPEITVARLHLNLGKIFAACHWPRLCAFKFEGPNVIEEYNAVKTPSWQRESPNAMFWASGYGREVEAAAARLQIMRIDRGAACRRFYDALGPNLLEFDGASAPFDVVDRSPLLIHIVKFNLDCVLYSSLPDEKRYPTVKFLSLTSSEKHTTSPETNNTLVISLLKMFPALTYLNTGDTPITSTIFPALIAHAPLHQLHLPRSNITEPTLIEYLTSRESELRVLVLSSSSTDALLDALSSSCPRLTCVYFGSAAFTLPRFKEWLHDTEQRGVLESVGMCGSTPQRLSMQRLVKEAGLSSPEPFILSDQCYLDEELDEDGDGWEESEGGRGREEQGFVI
ncbi:hypothetical protein BDK51DRAFT_33971, partial [Blyttiomyces helicus]